MASSAERFPPLRHIGDEQMQNAVALACGLGDSYCYSNAEIGLILRISHKQAARCVAEGIETLRSVKGYTNLAEELTRLRSA